ncbi:DUF6000 family protein [Streptomyces sp. enrichment culture]|uniref:DUF6000 family protein n=1 Tax=Streptomyces sp. enrichment culture TaxID=1795815 RepID=UPI001FB6DAFC|nr:DUF6000 family protein [Streptomyces sp. Tu 3180]
MPTPYRSAREPPRRSGTVRHGKGAGARPEGPDPFRPAAPGALLHLDARLGTGRAARFTQPGGLWGQWVNALTHLRDHPAHTPAGLRRRTGLHCGFAHGWPRP